MKHVRSDVHRRHAPKGELHGGELVAPFESAARWDHVVAALDATARDATARDATARDATARDATGFGAPVSPEPISIDTLTEVHDHAFVEFLATAWQQWTAAGHSGDMIPTCLPVRRMSQVEPIDIDGKLGYFAFAAETSIAAGTWDAAREAAAIALTTQRLVGSENEAAFALCRPPGHHAARDYFGGYCYLNNAAIAAQGFRNDGADRVAVLDVDFHHGNGTQDIFWDRDDVFFASLHGDPRHHFPYFLGFEDETGSESGDGATANYPLPPGTTFEDWFAALENALDRITAWGCEALVVSLGVDTYFNDPISSFRLATEDFATYGRRIGSLQLPTVYCMEGGYAVDEIGTNTVNVLLGDGDGRNS